eukprot:886475-Rhodomonas_salina.1
MEEESSPINRDVLLIADVALPHIVSVLDTVLCDRRRMLQPSPPAAVSITDSEASPGSAGPGQVLPHPLRALDPPVALFQPDARVRPDRVLQVAARRLVRRHEPFRHRTDRPRQPVQLPGGENNTPSPFLLSSFLFSALRSTRSWEVTGSERAGQSQRRADDAEANLRDAAAAV